MLRIYVFNVIHCLRAFLNSQFFLKSVDLHKYGFVCFKISGFVFTRFCMFYKLILIYGFFWAQLRVRVFVAEISFVAKWVILIAKALAVLTLHYIFVIIFWEPFWQFWWEIFVLGFWDEKSIWLTLIFRKICNLHFILGKHIAGTWFFFGNLNNDLHIKLKIHVFLKNILQTM